MAPSVCLSAVFDLSKKQWGGRGAVGAESERRRREERGAEGAEGGGVWGGGIPLPHWGWGLGLCPLPRKFLDFLYHNGDILGGIIYRVSKALLHAKWYFWSAKTNSYCRLRARKDRERQRKERQNRNKS